MLRTYLVITTESTLIVKAESEIDAMLTALHTYEDPQAVRVKTIKSIEDLPEVTEVAE